MGTIDVVAGVIKKDGRYLLARRNLNDEQGGLWEFPGGKVEEGESPEEALVRELKEELGIAIKAGKLLLKNIHRYPERSIRLLSYEIRLLDLEQEVVSTAHEEIGWFSIEDLSKIEVAPADRAVVKELAKIGTYK